MGTGLRPGTEWFVTRRTEVIQIRKPWKLSHQRVLSGVPQVLGMSLAHPREKAWSRSRLPA